MEEVLRKDPRPPDPSCFLIDEPVALKGITSQPSLNGRIAKVARGGPDAQGRVPVRLLGDDQCGKGQRLRVHASRLQPTLGSAANAAVLLTIRRSREALPGGDRWPRALAASEAGVQSVVSLTTRTSSRSDCSFASPKAENDAPTNPAELARRANNATTMFPSVLPRVGSPPAHLKRSQSVTIAPPRGPPRGPTGVWQVSTRGKHVAGWGGN